MRLNRTQSKSAGFEGVSDQFICGLTRSSAHSQGCRGSEDDAAELRPKEVECFTDMACVDTIATTRNDLRLTTNQRADHVIVYEWSAEPVPVTVSSLRFLQDLHDSGKAGCVSRFRISRSETPGGELPRMRNEVRK